MPKASFLEDSSYRFYEGGGCNLHVQLVGHRHHRAFLDQPFLEEVFFIISIDYFSVDGSRASSTTRRGGHEVPMEKHSLPIWDPTMVGY